MNEEEQLLFLKNIIKDLCSNNTIIYDDYQSIKEYIKNTFELTFDNPNYELLEYNLPKLLKIKYELNDNFDGKIIYHKNNIVIPDDYKKLTDHVDFIANLPQPEQRTEEWFNMRKNMITASCAAQVIGENPYPRQKPEDLILDKLNMGEPFTDNKFVHHGKKYEEVATKIYENIYDIHVDEYGLVPHIAIPKISFLGASPDGIASKYTLSNKFSPMIGRMLEIKCPYVRKIKTEGEIDGEICPHYYYCQVQQQLECCDLEYCDFWQCTLKEFFSKEDMLNDKTEIVYKEEQNVNLDIPVNCRQGCIIQLLPKDKITKFCLFDAKYIYPKNIDMTQFEYDQWILDEIPNLYKKYPKLMKDYVFDRILYWKLTVCHNVKIPRNKEWFKANYPKYKEVWDKIVLLRSNKTELNKFVKKYKKPKRVKKVKPEIKFIDSESSEEQNINNLNDNISIEETKNDKPSILDLFVTSESEN